MSECPGSFLEDFLAWNYDLTIDGDGSANWSLSMAEALGNVPRRRNLTKDQFKRVVEIFESKREYVENRLSDFYGQEECGWRQYHGNGVFDFVGDALYDEGAKIINNFLEGKPVVTGPITTVIQKPHDIAIALHGLGVINGIQIQFSHTDGDAEEMATVSGDSGELTVKVDDLKQFVDLGFHYLAIMKLKPSYAVAVMAWKEFEKNNKEELETYFRLKEKFGGI